MGLIVGLKHASGTQLCEQIKCMCDNERVKYAIAARITETSNCLWIVSMDLHSSFE